MHRSTTLAGLGLVLVLGLNAAAARAQEVGGEVLAASAYAWRGLYVSSRPVVQPSAYVSMPLGSTTLSASLWGNLEIARYDSRSAISEGGGAHGLDFTEWDPSLELAVPLGDSVLTLGTTWFFYPNREGLTHADNSAEVYAQLELPLLLSPTLGIWRDVDEIAGSYLEFGVSHEFKLSEVAALVLSGAAGWSHNQAENLDASGGVRRPGNFGEDGFTHWETGVALPVAWRGIQIAPSAHLIFGRDEWVRQASVTRSRDLKLWFGVTLSGARALSLR